MSQRIRDGNYKVSGLQQKEKEEQTKQKKVENAEMKGLRWPVTHKIQIGEDGHYHWAVPGQRRFQSGFAVASHWCPRVNPHRMLVHTLTCAALRSQPVQLRVLNGVVIDPLDLPILCKDMKRRAPPPSSWSGSATPFRTIRRCNRCRCCNPPTAAHCFSPKWLITRIVALNRARLNLYSRYLWHEG